MSDRKALCQRIADAIIASALANPFGGEVELASDRRCYVTLFSIPALLDGSVQLFSDKFILVRCHGKLAPGYDFEAVYDDVDNAIEAIMCICSVGPRNHDMLEAIPVRSRKTT